MRDDKDTDQVVKNQSELALLRSYRRQLQAEAELQAARASAEREKAARDWLDADMTMSRICTPSGRMASMTAAIVDRWAAETSPAKTTRK